MINLSLCYGINWKGREGREGRRLKKEAGCGGCRTLVSCMNCKRVKIKFKTKLNIKNKFNKLGFFLFIIFIYRLVPCQKVWKVHRKTTEITVFSLVMHGQNPNDFARSHIYYANKRLKRSSKEEHKLWLLTASHGGEGVMGREICLGTHT